MIVAELSSLRPESVSDDCVYVRTCSTVHVLEQFLLNISKINSDTHPALLHHKYNPPYDEHQKRCSKIKVIDIGLMLAEAIRIEYSNWGFVSSVLESFIA